jgi:antitoxin (DNA-binding transcriptional repressor) of toxin-antitoxin stability system
MSKTENIDEKLDDAFTQVAQGDQVTLHRYGRPIARLVPVDREFAREEALEAMRNILAMTTGAALGNLRLIDMIHEGHRY